MKPAATWKSPSGLPEISRIPPQLSASPEKGARFYSAILNHLISLLQVG